MKNIEKKCWICVSSFTICVEDFDTNRWKHQHLDAKGNMLVRL